MFWMIYTLYQDSLIFVRKNLFIVFPFFLHHTVSLLSNLFLSINKSIDFLLDLFLLILYLCLVETYCVAALYKREMLSDSEETVWQITNRFFGKVLLLFFTQAFFLLFLFIVYLILFSNANFVLENLFLTFFVLFAGMVYLLSLRHLIWHNPALVMDSIKAGIKNLYGNFFLYFSFIVAGGILTAYPSILFPISWALVPLLPIAERNSWVVYGGGINWFNLIVTPVLLAMLSIALTYIFLSRDKKEKHAS